jgi:hypothetical protein
MDDPVEAVEQEDSGQPGVVDRPRSGVHASFELLVVSH